MPRTYSLNRTADSVRQLLNKVEFHSPSWDSAAEQMQHINELVHTLDSSVHQLNARVSTLETSALVQYTAPDIDTVGYVNQLCFVITDQYIESGYENFVKSIYRCSAIRHEEQSYDEYIWDLIYKIADSFGPEDLEDPNPIMGYVIRDAFAEDRARLDLLETGPMIVQDDPPFGLPTYPGQIYIQYSDSGTYGIYLNQIYIAKKVSIGPDEYELEWSPILTIDFNLNDESYNPVANRVIKSALDTLSTSINEVQLTLNRKVNKTDYATIGGYGIITFAGANYGIDRGANVQPLLRSATKEAIEAQNTRGSTGWGAITPNNIQYLPGALGLATQTDISAINSALASKAAASDLETLTSNVGTLESALNITISDVSILQQLELGTGYHPSSVRSTYTYGTNQTTTAGAKGFHWLWGEIEGDDYTPQLSGTTLTLFLETETGFSEGDIVSIKADYSWNFAGSVLNTWTATLGYGITIQLVKTPPSNFLITESYWAENGYIWKPQQPDLGNVVIGAGAVGLGWNNKANELGAFACGMDNIADGRYSFVCGRENKAGYAAHAEGHQTSALELYAHTEGLSTIASGIASHAEGNGTTANGNYSHAEGLSTKALGFYSHSEGRGTTASGEVAHAEGYLSIASGRFSHAEGQGCVATNDQAHAEGFGTQSNGARAHAEGDHTIANTTAQHVEGIYNVALSTCNHIRGNGNSTTRKNIYTQNKSTGDVHLSGLVFMNDKTNNCTSSGIQAGSIKILDSVPINGPVEPEGSWVGTEGILGEIGAILLTDSDTDEYNGAELYMCMGALPNPNAGNYEYRWIKLGTYSMNY